MGAAIPRLSDAMNDNELTDIGGVMFSKPCLDSHQNSLMQHYGSNWETDPRDHGIYRKTRELKHGDTIIEGHRIWVFQWEDTFTVMETEYRGVNRRKVEVPRLVTETRAYTVSAPDEPKAREVFIAHLSPIARKWLEDGTQYKNLRVTEDPDSFAIISDSICVMDFCGRMGALRQVNMWADYFISEKLTRFGGAYWEVPDMPSDKVPTDGELEAWIKDHPTNTMEDLEFRAEHAQTMDFLARVKNFCGH